MFVYAENVQRLDIELTGLTDIFLEKSCEISLTRISYSASFREGCRLPEKSHPAEEYNKVWPRESYTRQNTEENVKLRPKHRRKHQTETKTQKKH
jgi:hypothetical protein